MLHEYHFKLNEEIYFKVLRLSQIFGKSLSATIDLISEYLFPFVEKNHLKAKEKFSKYKIIADLRQRRFSVHCYIPEELYRKMKHLHQDLNFYSLGQVIRKMIEYFLRGCEKYGIGGFIQRLKRIIKVWNEKKEVYIKEKRIFHKHMSYEYSKFPYITTTYGFDSRPYIIHLL